MGGSKAMTTEEVELCALRNEKFCKMDIGEYCMVFYHGVLLQGWLHGALAIQCPH